MRDVLGLAGGCFFALVSLAMIAWTPQWWCAVVASGALFLWSGGDLAYRAIGTRTTTGRWRWPFPRCLPLKDAAQLAYEAAERNGVVDLGSSPKSPPDVRLDHFAYVLIGDTEAVIYAAKPPSTRPRPRSHDEVKGLRPLREKNQLIHRGTILSVAYTDVSVRRSDLRRIIREYPKKAREFAASLKRP